MDPDDFRTAFIPDQAPRLTRRRLLRGLGVGLAGLSIAPIVAACGGSAATATPPPATKATSTSSSSSSSTAAAATSSSASSSSSAATSQASGGAASGSNSAASSSAASSSASSSAGAAYTPPAISTGNHSLTFLMWSHFVPAYDDYFDKYAKDWGTKNKVNVTVDHIPTNTIFQRSSAEVAAGTGHDLTLLENPPDTYIFADKLNDLTKLADYLGATYGGWLDIAKSAGLVKDTWRGIPDFYIPFPGLYRTDYFKDAGVNAFDKWSDMIDGGKKLKDKGHQMGFAISATGDSNSSLFGILWGYGAAVTAKDGKTITINSPETKAAIEDVVKIYQSAMTSEVLSWDDSSNNRLLASGVGSFILNPISAYRSAPPEIQAQTAVSICPAGPKGRVMRVPTRTWVNWKWTKDQAVAEKFLYDYFAQWMDGFKASTGYDNPTLKAFEKKPMPILGEDPKLNILQDLGQYAAADGYPGPSTAAASQVVNTYVIPNMFAKACTGSTTDQAIAFAEEQITSIYQKNPVQ
ncbi:MAG: ABC transporter substrate-binding protein [Thermomicrobiales bacterium]